MEPEPALPISRPPPAPRSIGRQELIAIGAFVLTVTLACLAFSSALQGGWVWDDTLDITGNPLLRDGRGLWRIWFHPAGLYDYYPIKYSVQWLAWQVWGDAPLGYHAINLLLHISSALLFGGILRRLGVRQGWIGGLLFAVHPLTVQSVAYLAELKNALSLPWMLLALHAWLDFEETGRRGKHVTAVLLFVAAMLCKTSVVMFPFALLLHAWWKRGRISRRDLLNSAPLFAVSLTLGMVTVWFQRHVAIGASVDTFNPVGGMLARLLCAGSSIVFYLWKSILPVGLAPIYPRWALDAPAAWVILAWPALGGLVWWFWRHRAGWGRHALFGFGWFVVFLLPVIGFVPISSQRFTWVMDHLAYIPLLGMVGLAATVFSTIWDRAALAGRTVTLGVLALATAGLTWTSYAHAAFFESEEALWTGTIAQQPEAWFAHFNLANLRRQEGRTQDAMAEYDRALQIRPEFADAHYNRGNLLRDAGRLDEAAADYRAAIRLNPNLFLAHANLAVVLAQQNRPDEAIAECRNALALQPDYPDARMNLGLLLRKTGHTDDAAREFETVLQRHPNSAVAHFNLANILLNSGHAGEAISHYEAAAKILPDHAQIEAQLAQALAQVGRTAEARNHYDRARRLDPSLPAAPF